MADAPTRANLAIDALRTRYAAASPFREDRELAEELMTESLPVLDTLMQSSVGGDTSAPSHEALAMLTLLGRRAGALGATPTAAYALFDALLDLSGCADIDDQVKRRRLTSLALEGFCAGREERLVAEGRGWARDALPMVELAPRVHALFIYGRHEPAEIATVIDAFGAQLLHSDAAAALVDASGFQDPTHESAAEIFGADANARMLGIPCVFAATPELLEHLASVSLDRTLLRIESGPTAGFRCALELAGIKLQGRRRILDPIRRVLEPKD